MQNYAINFYEYNAQTRTTTLVSSKIYTASSVMHALALCAPAYNKFKRDSAQDACNWIVYTTQNAVFTVALVK